MLAPDSSPTLSLPKHLLWSIARGVAVFFGGFSGLNLIGDLVTPGFDASGWWVELHMLPQGFAWLILILTSALLLGLAARPALGSARRRATLLLVMCLMAVNVADTLHFFDALSSGRIAAPRPLPISLLSLCALGLIYFRVWANDFRRNRHGRWQAGVVLASLALACPIAQMVLFGKTDYRRPADAVVVFGARVYSNGKPSLALADRVRTASRLVTSGQAKWLVVSGGPGDRGTHETLAMQRLAVSMGVPANRILVDRQGLTTHDTVQNSVPLLKKIGAARVLAVSHFYHLPRIKLAYQRAGVEVYTVPAAETRHLRRMPWFMAREVAALWLYYLSPLT